jgi:hypothetical protein
MILDHVTQLYQRLPHGAAPSAATGTEKSTIESGKLNAVAREVLAAPVPKACSLDDPDCEACQ